MYIGSLIQVVNEGFFDKIKSVLGSSKQSISDDSSRINSVKGWFKRSNKDSLPLYCFALRGRPMNIWRNDPRSAFYAFVLDNFPDIKSKNKQFIPWHNAKERERIKVPKEWYEKHKDILISVGLADFIGAPSEIKEYYHQGASFGDDYVREYTKHIYWAYDRVAAVFDEPIKALDLPLVGK